MTKEEEIFIILKRIPEQADYINKLLERSWILGPIGLPSYYDGDYKKTVRQKHHRLWNDENGLIPSAEGVLYNLINRLDELCQIE